MSGQEIYKERLRETFSDSTMPDFMKLQKKSALLEPLYPESSKLNKTQQAKP